MLGEATLDVSGTFAGEAIRLPIQIVALHRRLLVQPRGAGMVVLHPKVQ